MIKQLCSKCCILLIAWVASIPMAFGQIAVGAKTGINLNQFSQPGTTIGATIGAYGTYQVLPFLTARFEPQYSQEGGGRPGYTRFYNFTGDQNSTIDNVQYLNLSVVFHTVQLPVFVELSLPEMAEEAVKPKLMLGFSYGLVASAMEQHTKRYTFIDSTLPASLSPLAPIDVAYERENVTSNYSRNQWNAWIGMGVDFKSGSRTFSFDVRYRQGLRNLNLLRFSSPGLTTPTGYVGIPGTGGNLLSSSVSFNFSMSLFNF